MKKLQLFALLPFLLLSNSCLFSQSKIDFVSDALQDEIERFMHYEDSVVVIKNLHKGKVINIDFYRKDDGICYLSINSSFYFHKQGLIGGFTQNERLIAFYAGRNYCFVGLIDSRELKKAFPSEFIPLEESIPPPYQERTFEFRIHNPNELEFLNKNF